MPDIRKQATVTDDVMMKSFQEGLAEGMANRNLTLVWVVEVRFEGTKLNERRFEDSTEAMAFAHQNCETAGQSVTISCKWTTPERASESDSAPALGAGDDDIVDAEIIES